MTVAPLIAMKSSQVKSFDAVGRELDRRAHTYANDVDQSGRHIGYRCRAEDERPVPLEKAVERRMGELKTKRKVRENQVRAMGFIVSSNDALDEKSAREFLDRSINWFGARYGYENLLAAQIHLDEGTPHAHIWVAPVIHDRETGFDRLCAKELFAPDKRRKNAEGKWEVTAQGTMSRLQEDFWEQVAKPYGYERPMRHELRAKGYRSLDAYKVQVGTTRALKSEIETLEVARDKAKHGAMTAKRELDGLEQLRVESHVKLGALTDEVEKKRSHSADIDLEIGGKTSELDNLQDEIEQKILDLAAAKAECEAVSQRLESLRQREREVAGDVAELRPIAAEIGRWEAADRAGKRAILDSIADGCSALRERIQGRVERLGKRIEEVGARVRALREKVMPSTRKLKRGLKEKQESLDEMMDWARKSARKSAGSFEPERTRPRSQGQSR